MKKIQIQLPKNTHPHSCPIWIGDEILEKAASDLKKLEVSQVFMIADRRLRPHSKKLRRALEKIGWKVHLLWVDSTEALKSFEKVYPLYGYLLKKGADRRSLLVAVGGGVVGDAVGFLAGTYLRGIRWVGVPTTLLAQVDSCVGGKTGVNHEFGKNLIGLFHQPSAVICDSSFLKTLPPRDLLSGLGEVIKYGLILDPSLFWELKARGGSILKFKSSSFLVPWIQRCLTLKLKTVAKDEGDTRGIREILNFGHTLGHALEAETGFGYLRHGEAVILGMRLAAFLSVLRGHLNERAHLEIESYLSSLPVPKIPGTVKTQNLVARLKSDKKTQKGQTRFVLLKRIGKTILDSNVTSSEVAQAIHWMRRSP